MIKTIHTSRAIAEVVANCEPDVAACYPITPSTHISEQLEALYADGAIKEYIPTEAEFSSISALIGASAAGARTFSATSAQGLLLMHEALFNASGMRLPIVMAIANRAVSAPLNIWGDQQDSISQRDCGWIQIYCESSQEAVDSIPQAYKAAESALFPAMVCMDGFYLTHVTEQIDVPAKEEIARFLPAYSPKLSLNPEEPISLGVYATPEHYQGFREDVEADFAAAKEKITDACGEFAKLFGRNYGLIDSYKCDDAEHAVVGMGSMMAGAKLVVDELRAKGEKAGALRIRVFRPFPRDEIKKILAGKTVAVMEKSISPGAMPPVYADVAEALSNTGSKISSFTGGLGGRDVRRSHFREIFARIRSGKTFRDWLK